ncbi:MAG: hypothetical protein ACRC1K_01550, partial [Planctomycetia bacterium]
YNDEIKQSKFRMALMNVIDEGNPALDVSRLWWGHHWIHAQSWREEVPRWAQDIATYLAFAKKGLQTLDAVLPERERESNPKWKANYDLTYARLMQAKVRCDEVAWLLADFKLNPRTLKDAKKNNGWHYRWVEEIHQDMKPGEDKEIDDSPNRKTPINKKLAKAGLEAQAMTEKAHTYYQKILEEHPGTPWFEAARQEMSKAVGCVWVEAYDSDFDDTPERRRLRATIKVPKL